MCVNGLPQDLKLTGTYEMAQEKVTIVETLLFTCMSGVGGILSYCLRCMEGGEKPSIGRCILEGLSSAFVGLLAMFACKAMNIDWYWSGVIVGVFGWIGATASITFLRNILKRKMGGWLG